MWWRLGAEDLELHHLYRAMRWLGDSKDGVEEALFAARRDLFTELSLAFFDTTSLYFEGQGGESLGQYGHSKDHRPDLRQMVVGAVLTGDGRPVCCELWPGTMPMRGPCCLWWTGCASALVYGGCAG